MRVTNWRDALEEVFVAARSRAFRWGTHDCCQFAARCVHAVTGREPRSIFPGYRTKAEARAILERFGGMELLVTRALDQPVHPSRACEGDIVLIDMGEKLVDGCRVNTGIGLQPAVCMGLHSFAPGRRHLISRETLKAVVAWKV